MEPKTGKKIVSKGEYVKAEGKRIGMGFFGCGLLLTAFFFAWAAVGSGVGLAMGITHLLPHPDALAVGMTLLGLIVCPFCATVAYCSWKWGIANMERSETSDSGVPLTRANTADLPAHQTLVRASAEPMHAQQAVLLRAAVEGQETPPEHLVRAVEGL